MPEDLKTSIDWIPGKPLVFETANFRLRSLTADDATETYIGWWNDAEIQEGLGTAPRNWGRQQAVQHINRFNNRARFHLGIFPKGEDIPIGFLAIFLEHYDLARTNIVIGNKDYWGRGVPLEVRGRALEVLFEHFKVAKVYGRLHARNYASIFNYKAQGFTCEAILRQHEVGPDGERRDMLMFGLLREEWRETQAKQATP